MIAGFRPFRFTCSWNETTTSSRSITKYWTLQFVCINPNSRFCIFTNVACWCKAILLEYAHIKYYYYILTICFYVDWKGIWILCQDAIRFHRFWIWIHDSQCELWTHKRKSPTAILVCTNLSWKSWFNVSWLNTEYLITRIHNVHLVSI